MKTCQIIRIRKQALSHENPGFRDVLLFFLKSHFCNPLLKTRKQQSGKLLSNGPLVLKLEIVSFSYV